MASAGAGRNENVVPEVHEILHRPLDVVRKLFEQRSLPHAGDSEIGLAEMMERLSIGVNIELPSLNFVPLDQLKDGMLVKYRCMVQDILNPEYYLAVYEEQHAQTGQKTIKSAKYRDILDNHAETMVVENSSVSQFGQRYRLYCVPIPAQSSWANDMLKPKSAAKVASVDQTQTNNAMDVSFDEAPRRGKRAREEAEPDSSAMDVENFDEQVLDSKRIAPSSPGNNADADVERIKKDAAPHLNFPIPGSTGVPCVVKMYDTDEDTFKVSDIVEFEGILSHSHGSNVVEGEEDEADLMMRDYTPPAGLVPQLHCVRFRKLESVNPISDRDPVDAAKQLVSSVGSTTIAETRAVLLRHLTECFFGDELAATYVLLHLLSRVYSRVGELDPLGNFPLNLSHVPLTIGNASVAAYVHNVLAELVAAVHVLSLSIESLKTSQFVPYKDYDHERLISGQLQLAPGTHIIVDETVLTPGQLESKPYEQLIAVGTVIASQRVTYDFKYHQTDVPTDLPAIVLSSGKSMFKCCQLPVKVSPQWSAPSQLEPEMMAQLRTLIANLSFMDTDPGSEEMKKQIQDDFVAKRQSEPSFTADNLRMWLSIARLMAISFGSQEVQLSHWEDAKKLEKLRLERVQSMNPSKAGSSQ